MLLDEARLKSYLITREAKDGTWASGLTAPAEPTTFTASLDLQQSSSPRFVVQAGEERFSGAYRAFTYDTTIAVGDRLLDTPFGPLRVEAVYPWDDEDPTHYEIGLVPA